MSQTLVETPSGRVRDAASEHISLRSLQPGNDLSPANASTRPDTAHTSGLSHAQTATVMACLCACVFVSALDVTIITTALPSIAGHFASTSGYTWVGTGFILAHTASTPSWGGLSDIWGRRPVLLAACVVFFAGSLMCALVDSSLAAFIAGRAVQGLGAAGLTTMVNVCISDMFPPRDRGMYYGLTSVVWAVASGVGPVMGGLFTSRLTRNLTLNAVPITGAVFLLLFLTLKLPSPRTPLRAGLAAIDWMGSLLVVGGTLMLLLGLYLGGVYDPWHSATVVCLIVFGFLTGGLFVLNEWKLAVYPVMPIRLFRTVSSAAAYGLCFFHSFVFLGVAYYLPMYFQAVLLAGPLTSGVYLLPFILSSSLSAALTGVLIQTTGKYMPAVYSGMVIMTLGIGLLIDIGMEKNWARLVSFQIVGGIGVGMNFEGPLLAVQAVVPPGDVAAATTTMGFTRTISTAISVVIGGVVFQNEMNTKKAGLVAELGEELAARFDGVNASANVELVRSLPPMQQAAVQTAYHESMRSMWIMLHLQQPLRRGPPMSSSGIAPVLSDEDNDESVAFAQDTEPLLASTDMAAQRDESVADVSGLRDVDAPRRVLKKIDRAIIPLLFVTYMLNFMDKIILSSAAVFGLREDNHLHGQQYSWVGSAFYFGYLVWTYPTSILIARLPTAKYLAANTLFWGTIVTLTAACSSFGALLAVRFLLGVAEATISPAFMYLTSTWYTRDEIPVRVGIWFAGNSIGGIISSLLAFGIGHVDGPISPWRWMYIVLGVATFLWSVPMFILLPDTISKARFLTPQERQLAASRVVIAGTGASEGARWRLDQVVECLVDPKTWLIFPITLLTQIPNGSTQSFSNIVIQSFGFTNLQSTLINLPYSLVSAATIYGTGYLAGRFRTLNCLLVVAVVLPCVIGAAIIFCRDRVSHGVQLVAYFLLSTGPASLPLVMAMVSSNYRGVTKKMTITSMLFVAYCTGNIVGPLLFRKEEDPTYATAFAAIMICYALVLVLTMVLRCYLLWLNAKRTREEGFEGSAGTSGALAGGSVAKPVVGKDVAEAATLHRHAHLPIALALCIRNIIRNATRASPIDSNEPFPSIEAPFFRTRVTSAKMSWRHQGITGSNNIPLGKSRRLGGEPELDGPDRDLKRGRDPEPRTDDGPRRRKKRNRWGDASENKAAGLMGLPTAIKANMTSEQLEAYTLHLRIEEISQKLRIDDVVPADGDRSPSPPPQYDNHGRRVNTREYRYRKRLEDERHKLVERAMKTIPNYHPPQDYRRPTKTQEKVYVPVNDYPEINFIGLLIGPRGNTLKKMESESGAKIAIRGKGSVKEGKGRSDAAHSSNQEEDLHCLIMADTEDKINKAKQLIHNVIETAGFPDLRTFLALANRHKAASVPEGQNDLKRNQLRELAALNGTLRDDENQACQNCGKIGHRKYDCPERQNFTASVICRVCGNAGHFARDCPDRQRGTGWRNDVGNGRPAGRIGGGDAVDREMEQFFQELGGGPSAAPAQIEAGPNGGHENGDVKPWQRPQGGGAAPWRPRNQDSRDGGGSGGSAAPWARDRNRGHESQSDSYYGQGYGSASGAGGAPGGAAPWHQAPPPPPPPGASGGYSGYGGYGGYGSAAPGMNGAASGPVTFWTTVIYLAVVVPLLYVHETVPPAPRDDQLQRGLNLSEAWSDLQHITKTYHPYNSHENDRVRDFIIARSKDVLDRNGLDYTTDTSGGVTWRYGLESAVDSFGGKATRRSGKPPGATIFDDRVSNVTYTYEGRYSWVGQYFEGSNVYVYIHGKEDPEGEWWLTQEGIKASRHTGGVLVNCHFDSVSTGYGATDDGMSCVTLLQLLSYFTSEGRQPRNGIVLLFNNAEEDGLLGANAFGYSPLLSFCHTFVNLEGAGAGGRAMLFRTTDVQVASAYGQSPHPFGSVVAANAFERGVIKSGTDYQVFAGIFGQRGLDIAFYEPRARYHTEEDDTRHTSVRSIWHMLSAALASTKVLSETTSTEFNGPRSDGRKDLAQNGRPTAGVWFDFFGDAWAAFPLRGLFAWSLTLLIATPLVLVIVTYLIIRNDRYYYFAGDLETDSEAGDGKVSLGGWKGFFRFPLALIFATGLTIGSVYLVAKFNPLIIGSSGYAVWAMTMSLFYFAFWLIMRGSSFVRPSALHRGFVLIWLFVLTWVIQVFAAVAEDRMGIGALYFAAFLHTSVFSCLLISLLEQLALPGKQEFARQLEDAEEDHAAQNAPQGPGEAANPEQQEEHDGDDGAEATETTPLRTGEQNYGSNTPTTFASTYRRSVAEPVALSGPTYPPYESEQSWSGRLPTWTWFLQLLLLAPVHVIILGNLGLVETAAMAMTGPDGSSLLTPLMGIGILSILLLIPLSPFIHRVTHHIPLFLLLVFAGTLIYNLVAFPFSTNNRFKLRFQQTVDLDDGSNVVSLIGLEEFVRPVIASLPAASGQTIKCYHSAAENLMECKYDASSLPPNPADGKELDKLVSASVTRSADGLSAGLHIEALNTRLCYVDLSEPIFGFSVEGGGTRDERFGPLPRDGLKSLQLWRRTWDGTWNVTLQLSSTGHSTEAPATGLALESGSSKAKEGELKARSSPFEVTVKCAWDDANRVTNIPALHELKQYMPNWATVTKRTMGLVLVKKTYQVLLTLALLHDMVSLPEEIGDLFQGWSTFWARCRREAIVSFAVRVGLDVLAAIVVFVLVVFVKLWSLCELVWPFINPWSPRHRERRERKMERDSLSKLFLASAAHTRPPIAPSAGDAGARRRRTPSKRSPLFDHLPAEVRREILLLAFGERTLHMDLSFRAPLNLVPRKPCESWPLHAGILSESLASGSHLVAGRGKRWRWFGCVCHRFPPGETGHLSFGRRRNNPWNHFREPDSDRCLEGAGECNRWPGKWPDKCQIGVLGWLLTCRQAYAEGVEVLYKTNTIHIESPVLLRSIQDLIPRQRLSDITSLELLWKPKELPLRLGFSGREGSSPCDIPLFSSLRHLRLTFKYLVYGEIDEATGLEWPYEDQAALSRALHERLFPEIDDLLERIAPPTAHVVVSCCKWDWYELTDLYLLEKQGEAKTRLQRADVEGLKCWRETPPRKASSIVDMNNSRHSVTRREGYWIHSSFEDVQLDPGATRASNGTTGAMISSIWHPSGLRSPSRRVLIYFICGNPGLVGYYADFLGALHGMLDATPRIADAGPRIAYDIYGKNLAGFSDAEHEPFGAPGSDGPQPWDLDGQVESVYDDVASRSRGTDPEAADSPPPPGPGDDVRGERRRYDFVVLVGHSIGSYIALEVFHRHAQTPSRAPHLRLRHGFLLFPTIVSIGLSPSGRRVQALRSVPGLAPRAHQLARLALAPWTAGALGWFIERFMGFSAHAAAVTAEWLKSRDGIRQALHLGLSELDGVREDAWGEELWEVSAEDTEGLDGPASAAAGIPKFFLFYGQGDHWVADHVRDEFIERRRQHGERGGATSIAVDEGGLPHAFCTTEHNSWVVAKRVCAWVEEIERGMKV
ncbi:cyanamide hydratase [Purpureocillium lavendulum]|uniref:Branchpoint-bridging protein n=1 Tax=Purpureocillium lavendulum TaxID=1247861 RepID=A0AB34FTC9_9HYPO|nr:cyanamide hydratase [Purpureocillium lavendulum]